MINIAIVEDENNAVNQLRQYLKRYETDNSEQFQISVFKDGLDIVSDYTADYDIILLDIQMKHMNGMEAAEKIRELDEDVAFIFITSSVHFAVQGYLVDALGYIVKPVAYPVFAKTLDKAVKSIKQRQTDFYLNICVKNGQMRLNINDIYYIESQRHNIILHTVKGEFLTPGPLKDLEKALSEKGFSRCHNAFLINLKHAAGIQNSSLILSNGEELPISRTRKKTFMENLTGYMGGVSL